MEARIERLGSVGKEVAKRAALIGRRFTREAVSRIWDLASVDLDRGLAALRESETIYEEESRVVLGEMEAVFRHGRLQEAALAMIPRQERVRWRAILEGWARAKLASMGASWEGAGPLLLPIIARSLEDQGEDWNASLWFEVLGLLLRKHHHGREAVAAFTRALSSARGTRSLVLRRIIAEEELFAAMPSARCASSWRATNRGRPRKGRCRPMCARSWPRSPAIPWSAGTDSPPSMQPSRCSSGGQISSVAWGASPRRASLPVSGEGARRARSRESPPLDAMGQRLDLLPERARQRSEGGRPGVRSRGRAH